MNERMYNPCIGAAEFSHWALYTVHSSATIVKIRPCANKFSKPPGPLKNDPRNPTCRGCERNEFPFFHANYSELDNLSSVKCMKTEISTKFGAFTEPYGKDGEKWPS
jgi:hypothetical protein